MPEHPNYKNVTFQEGFTLELDSGSAQRGTAVLFHGLTGSPAELRDLSKVLNEEGFRVVVPQLFGHSGDIDELKRVRASQWLSQAEMVVSSALNANPSGVLLLGGLSFGALLAACMAERFLSETSGYLLLSPPWRLRSDLNESLLSILTFFPKWSLDFLGTKRKSIRDEGYLELPHMAYPEHPIGAVVRMLKIRKIAFEHVPRISQPVFIAHDPNDHHVATEGIIELRKFSVEF